jgi:hypothetical protein
VKSFEFILSHWGTPSIENCGTWEGLFMFNIFGERGSGVASLDTRWR